MSATPSSPPDIPLAERLLRAVFVDAVRRDAAGTPLLSPEVVSEQGARVRLLDVREREELVGPFGHIPAVTHMPLDELASVPRILGTDTCVVLVSNVGKRAAVAARYLEALGMHHVAALDGGMARWKTLGFALRRDDSFKSTLRPLQPGESRTGGPLRNALQRTELPTARDVEDHVGDPGAIRWVRLAAFLLHGKRSCIDGRDDNGVIGAPGGDAGELLLALATVEARIGRPLTDTEVEAALLLEVDTFGRFYMHTDAAAMNRLIVDGLRQDPRVRDRVVHLGTPAEWRAFALAPPVDLREALLEHLERPAAMGCGHLKALMTDEARYGVRPALTRSFLRAFHRMRWAGAPELEWVVLGGVHEEAAVLEVILDEELRSYTRVPMISPAVRGRQVFVSHPQVGTYQRDELAHLLASERFAGVDGAWGPELSRAMHERGTAQAHATLAGLAAGLPIFEVRFDRGRPHVRQTGVVPGGSA